MIVAGGMNRDYFIYTETLPKPGETVFAKSVQTFPGGKGLNAAAAAAHMRTNKNINIKIFGTRGADPEGDDCTTLYHKLGIETDMLFTHKSEKTGLAFVTVDEKGENAISVCPGSNWTMDVDHVKEIHIHHENKVVALANFEINVDAITALFERVKSHNGLTILNPSPMLKLNPNLARNVDIVVVNEDEVRAMITLHKKEIEACCENYSESIIGNDLNKMKYLLVRALRLGVLIVTLGKNGCEIWRCWGDDVVPDDDDNQPTNDRVSMRSIKAIQQSSVVDTTGAGDCFVGTLTTCIAEGIDIQNSALLANMMAGNCVRFKGASPSYRSRHEVIPDVHSEGKNKSLSPYQSRNYEKMKFDSQNRKKSTMASCCPVCPTQWTNSDEL